MYCLIFNQLYAYNDLQISKVEFSYGGISKYKKNYKKSSTLKQTCLHAIKRNSILSDKLIPNVVIV